MIKVYLTTDPKTQRGLYDSESEYLGLFTCVQDAARTLGDILKYCSIRSA